jgi:hypothetical protein
MLHKAKGGSRETELNELIVTPTGFPELLTAVTTQTPVANCPKAFLKAFKVHS